MRTHWGWTWEEKSLVLRSGATLRIALTPHGLGWLALVGSAGRFRKTTFRGALAMALDMLDLPAALRALLERDALALYEPPAQGQDGSAGVEYAVLVALIAALAIAAALAFGGVSTLYTAPASDIAAAAASASGVNHPKGAGGEEASDEATDEAPRPIVLTNALLNPGFVDSSLPPFPSPLLPAAWNAAPGVNVNFVSPSPGIGVFMFWGDGPKPPEYLVFADATHFSASSAFALGPMASAKVEAVALDSQLAFKAISVSAGPGGGWSVNFTLKAPLLIPCGDEGLPSCAEAAAVDPFSLQPAPGALGPVSLSLSREP